MSVEVGSFEAKNRLSELLAVAERGERVYITRRGKRIAVLMSAGDDDEKPATAKALLEQFTAFRKGARRGRESLRALIEVGRR